MFKVFAGAQANASNNRDSYLRFVKSIASWLK